MAKPRVVPGPPDELDALDANLVVWAREIPDLDPLTEGIVERIQHLAHEFDAPLLRVIAADDPRTFDHVALEHFLREFVLDRLLDLPAQFARAELGPVALRREMLDELKGSALLHGARGSEPANLAAIVDVLLRVGGTDGLMMRGAQELAEIDINPLIVSRDAAIAADARFILRREA